MIHRLHKIIYVRTPKGLKVTEIYEPLWVTGAPQKRRAKKDAAAAYSLDTQSVIEDKEE